MAQKPTKSTDESLDGWALLRLALRNNHRQELIDNQLVEEQEKFWLDQRHKNEIAHVSSFPNPMGWAQTITRYQAQQDHNRLVNQARREWTLNRQQKELADLEKWITQQQQQASDVILLDQLYHLFNWSLTIQQLNYYYRALNNGYTIIITDLQKKILWASQSFVALTGYQIEEVMGQHAGLLQGPGTSQATVRHIEEQLTLAQPIKVELLNYTKNKESYICHMQIDPLYNCQGLLTHFSAIECAVV